MNALESMISRRSTREYLDKDIPDEILKTLIQAAMHAPFGGKPLPQCQVFEAIIIRDNTMKQKLALEYKDRQFIRSAPVIIACLANKNNDLKYNEWNTSVALSIENLIIAAELQNIGSCFLSCFLNHAEHKNDKQLLRQILNLPKHIELVGIVTLGYKNEKETIPEKILRDFGDVVSYEKYGCDPNKAPGM